MALVGTVWVLNEAGSEKVPFGPDDDVPDWASKQMGDHCFVDGQRPDTSGGGPYSDMKKADLQAEVDRRNENRGDDAKITVAGKGTVEDLKTALEADDTNQS